MAQSKGRRVFGIALIVASIGSLYFVPWKIVLAWLTPLPDTIEAQLEAATDESYEGVIVYIDQAGKPPQTYAAGWHDRELKIPAKPDALFKIASINKLYNAVSVAKLVRRGKLSLDSTLAHYKPDLIGRIENAEKITLRLMIQHRSGIPNFTDTPDYWSTPGLSNEENLALILDKPANFEPGEDYEYCNTNYLLLNMIMDDVLGYENYQFVQSEILNPLGLKNTFRSLEHVDMDQVMSGYHLGHPHDLKEDPYGMLATAEDVGKFLRALNNGDVFQEGEMEIYKSIYEFEHGGWVPGYQSFANYHPEIDAVAVHFYSTTDSDLILWNLSELYNKRVIDIHKTTE